MEQLRLLAPVLKEDDAVLDDAATAALIRKTRLGLNIQQKSVALQLGITQSYLGDLESGRRHIKLSMFKRIKSALMILGAASSSWKTKT